MTSRSAYLALVSCDDLPLFFFSAENSKSLYFFTFLPFIFVAYMHQEEEWDREGLLDPAWERQQRKVQRIQ
jgi:hypothetical protein